MGDGDKKKSLIFKRKLKKNLMFVRKTDSIPRAAG